VIAPQEGHFQDDSCNFLSDMYRAIRQDEQTNVTILSGLGDPEMMVGASDGAFVELFVFMV
jgi:hypothetical protein